MTSFNETNTPFRLEVGALRECKIAAIGSQFRWCNACRQMWVITCNEAMASSVWGEAISQ